MKVFAKTFLRRRPRMGASVLRIARRLGVPIPGQVSGRLRQAARATGLFDEAFYLHAYPDVGASPLSALDHFLLYGAREGRNPNRAFSVGWYVANTPELARSKENPILHYARVGEAEGRAPSRAFDPAYYLERYPELAGEKPGLLAHYLTVGRAEGRDGRRGGDAPVGQPAAAARIVEVKPLTEPFGKVALVACPAAGGGLPPHVEPLVATLRAAGYGVALIVLTDAPLERDGDRLDLISALYVREAKGGSFAAWSHVLQLEAHLYAAKALVLIDAGRVAVADPARVARTLEALAARRGTITGLCDGYTGEWHIWPGLLHLKAAALGMPALQRFISDVRIRATPAPDDVEPEARAFAGSMRAALLETGVLHAMLDAGPDTDEVALTRRALDSAGFVTAPTGEVEIQALAPSAPLIGPKLKVAARQLQSPAPPRKVDYFGPWNFESGLGAASRGMITALWRAPVRLNLRPVRGPFHVHARHAPTVDALDFHEPADAAIVHLNPDSLRLLTDDQRGVIARARLRIGLWVWETDAAPLAWTQAAEGFDAVWAPSRYCAEVFVRAFPGKPVHIVPHVVETPAWIPPADRTTLRAAFGVPAERRLILYVFDGASVVARKNPAALARAFLASGLGRRGWALVLKTRNLDDHAGQGRELRALAASEPHIVLIDARADAQALAALMVAAEIYASPHCAEGFGLTVAEAMALGKSVIATDYSGVRDFLDAEVGYPVAFTRETLARDEGLYRKGESWASINEGALAAALLQAADDLDAGRGPGARARARIAGRLGPGAVARATMESLETLLTRADQAA